jgi:hypothetical protein
MTRAIARRTVVTLSLTVAACGLSLVATAFAQATASPPQTPPATEPQIVANMNQLMRGVLYPAANVVFSAQQNDPAAATPGPLHDPSMSTDPLISTYGGWQAIENAALGLAESANLLLIPGRTCANGVPAPTKDPAWVAFVQEVRDASMKAYKAAQAKDQEKMIEISEPLSRSCSGCHRKWRDRRTPENRCK